MDRKDLGNIMEQHILLLHPLPGGPHYLRSALQMWVTRERPMALGSMRYWDVSTMALTPPSTGTLSCSTERELSRQAPRGRSVRQRLRQSGSHRVPPMGSPAGSDTGGAHTARGRGMEEMGCTKPSPDPPQVPAALTGAPCSPCAGAGPCCPSRSGTPPCPCPAPPPPCSAAGPRPTGDAPAAPGAAPWQEGPRRLWRPSTGAEGARPRPEWTRWGSHRLFFPQDPQC